MSDKTAASCEKDVPKAGKLYLYANTVLTAKVAIHINEVGQTTKQNLEEAMVERVANKCVEEGYIRPKSLRIQTYSAGVVRADQIDFHVVYQCQVARPVEGQVLEATVKTITKAGIHAQCVDSDGNIPVTVFIARDHHTNSQEFQNVKEGDKVYACVIGTRYELNDPYICVIAKLIPPKYSNRFQNRRIHIKGGEIDLDPEDIEVEVDEVPTEPEPEPEPESEPPALELAP